MFAAAVMFAALSTTPAARTAAVPFVLQPKDHICIVGNALAERMQHDGWLETQLYARFPSHELVIRNLAWSGDEVVTRLREKNFGTPDEWLSGNPEPIGGYSENRFAGVNTKADVIFAFFGYNESFGGDAGLPKFKTDLAEWITHTLAQKYNGKSAPRIVLFSPIAYEDLNNPDLPAARDVNARLAPYARAIGEVAQAHNVRFVDLFAPSQQLYTATRAPLTINGLHLTADGNRLIAQVIDKDLFGPARAATPAYLTKLRQAVADKSRLWYDRYRVTDGYNVYGDRAFLTFVKDNPRNVNANQVTNKADVLPGNYEVMQRESQILDVMTANRDRRIWAIARGQDPAAAGLKADDSDTPPTIDAKTNEPGKGPNGAHIYLPGEAALERMTVAPGLKVNLFASETDFPELVNPVQIAFDTRGRLWVAVWKNYPHWQPKTPMDDKLLILEDTNGDGKADKRTVFAGDLNNPTGFEFYKDGVILAQAPNLLFLRDTNGDDKYDTKEILLSGFDTADTHHTINSFTFDPGGALYMQEGIFMRSQVETPWTPPVRENDGAVWRFEPRTSKLEVYVPMNFPNPHGHVFDEWGRDIIFDATGGQSYYGPSFTTKKYYPAMETNRAPRPGPTTYKGQNIRPVGGAEILSSRHFPESMQGSIAVFNTITFRGALNYKLSEDGAGLKWQEVEPILGSAEESFRPVDGEIGPDGALYIADWQNPIIGHMQHNLRDTSRGHDHGRIYRVIAAGRPLLTPAKIAGQPIPALLELLKEPENRVRYRAKIELSGRDTAQVVAATQAWIDKLDTNAPNYEHQMMEALWVYQWMNRVNEPLLKRMLRSKEPWARAAATRVLCYWRDRVQDPLGLLKVQATDEHPGVRLEAVRTASFFKEKQAAEVALASLDKPQDRFLEYALAQTMKTLEPFIK